VFLKSIDLLGFKSFADKSRIEFTEGISALLGPNGCGKSNVVDAVKWVLGEQSTRTLRADKMEDVIFNGTENRKALNVAEVTLTLSNDEGLLPVDISELAVKRRLYRSGESEYFINNQPALLREVRELFFDTGIGKSAYSIMEQGKIDQILSNKPEERRYIFEEAAGITKYKSRGAEAERKLARTEENMHQVENILKEVKRSHDSLATQAKKTATYRELREKIFEAELKQQLLKLRGFLDSQHEKQELLTRRISERDELRAKIEGVNTSMESELDEVNTKESELIEKQKELYGLELEANNCESRIQLHTERLAELTRSLGIARDRQETLVATLEQTVQQIDERSKSLEEITLRISEIEENIASFEQNIDHARNRIIENDREITASGKAIAGFETETESLQAELRDLYDDIVTQLDTRLKETGYSHQRRRQAEEELLEAIRSVEIHVSGRIEILGDAVRVSARHDDRSLAESTLAALTELREKVSELSAAVDTFRSNVPEFIDEFLAPQGIITRKREIDAKIVSIRDSIAEYRRRIDALQRENHDLRGKIEAYRKTLEDLRLNRERMRTQRTSIEESIALLSRQRRDLEEQATEGKHEIERSEERLAGIEEAIASTRQKKEELQKAAAGLAKNLGSLERDIAERNRRLVSRESETKRLAGNLQSVQSSIDRLQLETSTVGTEIRNVYDNFQDRYSRDLKEFEERLYEISDDPAVIRDELVVLRGNLRDLGSVNLMAPEEFAEVKERFDFLTTQLDDLRTARKDLHTVTEQIRFESTELFLETYDRIKRNFHSMFRRLFGGGRAELSLTDGSNVLESGIDILVQPPGKKLESIDLLSGGEKSMTGVALLFATYMVKPSPFCILDEIDAALDEENVGRFVNLLHEFSRTSQFIVITHNKRTVANAESLLGVTMEESGVSKIIAVRLSEPVGA
jgi:chromosome segregation protein